MAGAAASLAAGWLAPGMLLGANPGLTALLWITGLQEILLIGIPAALIALRSRASLERLKQVLALPDPVHAGLSMLGAVAFTMAGLLITLAAFGALQALGIPPDAPPAIDPGSLPQLLVAILCAALIPAVCEELLFRGVLWAALERRAGLRWAAAVSAFLFAALHFTLLGFPVLLALGFLLARVMQKRRSLILCVLFHAMYNLSILVINYSGSNPGLFLILLSCGIAYAALRLLLKEEQHGIANPRV